MSTLFVASTVYPPPTQSAWSGGSSENWFPPFASRWSRWFRPALVQSSSGLEPATAADGTVGASSGFFGNLPFLNPGRGRLKLPAPSASALPCRISGCWKASTPVDPARIVVVPPLGIWRGPPVVAEAAAMTPMTSPAARPRPRTLNRRDVRLLI